VADVRLLAHGFDAGVELTRFTAAYPAAGGVVSFLGQVRAGDSVEALDLRHYGPLTLPSMAALADNAAERWALAGLLAIRSCWSPPPRVIAATRSPQPSS
jgi:molybdopterin synthase catalytic subunit